MRVCGCGRWIEEGCPECDRDLGFQELRDANVRRCEESFFALDHWSPTDWACALAGEVGEACNLVKKLRRGEEVEPYRIGYELADTVIYADLLAARLGLDLGELVRTKFNIVSDRKGSTVKLRALGKGESDA